MSKDQVVDQLQGLVYGVLVAVAVAILPILRDVDPDAFWTTGFWATLGATAVRSAGTALLTVLGVKIPGVSGGKSDGGS